jgi:ribonuclease P protein component
LAKRFTLGRKERLKSRKQIDALFLEGKKFTVSPFRIHYLVNTGEGIAIRFGIGVSSKVFRKAVDRNRVKRLAREAWRLQKGELDELVSREHLALQVFVVFTGRELPQHAMMMEQMLAVIQKLHQQLSKKN